jgi:hypothetical protein
MVRLEKNPDDRPTGNACWVASEGVQALLAQEIENGEPRRSVSWAVDPHLPARSGSKLRKCKVFLSRFGSLIESTVEILFGRQRTTDHVFL